jgi:SH3-like domain-containing protein
MPPLRSVLLAASFLSAGAAEARQSTAPPLHHETHHHRPAPVHHPHHRPTHHQTGHRPPATVHAAAPPPAPVPPPKPVPPPPPVGTVTGLPLPRFASLRSDEVNLRSGPGIRYPIQWVYKRRDLPVEIEREYDVWRLVRLGDGTEGWVHQATLIGDRTCLVRAASGAGAGDLATAQTLRATAAADGAPVAYLKPGVIGRVLSCPAGSDWCRIQAHGVTGYLRRDAMWGLLPDEVVAAH